jgi:hypothetical protein
MLLADVMAAEGDTSARADLLNGSADTLARRGVPPGWSRPCGSSKLVLLLYLSASDPAHQGGSEAVGVILLVTAAESGVYRW